MAFAQTEPPDLARLWVIDSAPGPITGAFSGQTAEVIATLKSLPSSWTSRDAFVQAVCNDGHPKPIAQWLAMNLTEARGGTDDDAPGEDGAALRFGLDLAAIEALLTDYANQDLWSVIESPPEGIDVSVILGGASDVWSPRDQSRARATTTRLHVVENAGHWVHVDAPDAVVRLLAAW